MRIPTGEIDRYIYFVATLAGSRVTGLSSFTVYGSKNGAAAAAFTGPTINETDATNMPGVYELLVSEQTTLTAGNDTEELALHITEAGMDAVTRTVEIYRPETTEGRTLTIEADGDLTKVNTLHGHTAQTGDSYARIGAGGAGLTTLATAAALTVVDNEIETIDTVVDAIKLVTDLLPDAGALTSLATQVSNDSVEGKVDGVVSDVTSLHGKVDLIDTIVDAILEDTATTIPGLIAALENLSAAQVLTQVNAALDAPIAELGVGQPTATPSQRVATMLLYMALRNGLTVQTSGADELQIQNSAGAVIAKKTLADAGGDYTETKMVSGP